jgi:CubicO group peptidase (beta-lactamase class C family)
MMPSRRQFIHLAATVSALPTWTGPLYSVVAQPALASNSTPQPQPSERARMAYLAHAFMERYDVPGLSVAIGRAGTLVYEQAFGWADREKREAVAPQHLFRIASVTKPITAVAIFSLIEQGRIRLTDRVFGPGSITGDDYFQPPYQPSVGEITIEHLLTHTAGGWASDDRDPMFINLEMSQAQLIEWTLRSLPLSHLPGQHFAYSNFGYCVLGRVIEKITGQAYAIYVSNSLLKRCGISNMMLAGNTLAERRPWEVKYYGQGENPYGMNVTRMDSHGGWLSGPADIVQFLMHVDGLPVSPNILGKQTIQTMTTPSPVNAGYAKGWAVNKAGNWWHNGSLPGSATVAVRTHSGFCWAAFANTRRLGSQLEIDLDNLIWSMVGEAKSWRV